MNRQTKNIYSRRYYFNNIIKLLLFPIREYETIKLNLWRKQTLNRWMNTSAFLKKTYKSHCKRYGKQFKKPSPAWKRWSVTSYLPINIMAGYFTLGLSKTITPFPARHHLPYLLLSKRNWHPMQYPRVRYNSLKTKLSLSNYLRKWRNSGLRKISKKQKQRKNKDVCCLSTGCPMFSFLREHIIKPMSCNK